MWGRKKKEPVAWPDPPWPDTSAAGLAPSLVCLSAEDRSVVIGALSDEFQKRLELIINERLSPESIDDAIQSSLRQHLTRMAEKIFYEWKVEHLDGAVDTMIATKVAALAERARSDLTRTMATAFLQAMTTMSQKPRRLKRKQRRKR